MLTGKKQKALEALLVCGTRQEAAIMAGITEKTLRGYIRDDEFAREYRRIFRGKLDEATRHGQRNISNAMQTFASIMGDKEAAPMARIAAGRALCEFTLRMTEISDIISVLEGEADVL